MRRSREVKAQSHEVIVNEAARLFRERGVASTSVADVMQSAKLTHGGFYRHFQSKDDLLAAAIATAFDQILAHLEPNTPGESPRAAVDRYASMYLSDGHVSSPGLGCPVASLGTEMARAPKVAVDASAAGIDRMIEAVATRLGGAKSTSRERAIHMLATLVGAVVIARAAGDADVGQEVLGACRQRMGV